MSIAKRFLAWSSSEIHIKEHVKVFVSINSKVYAMRMPPNIIVHAKVVDANSIILK